MSASWKEIHLYPKNIQFAVLSADEIRKISVVKIVTSLTFDELGKALPGGLYDPLLGTYGKSNDACGTCFSLSYCPGHLGHIELNTLVYNPFFLKVLYDILKISCIDCHKIQVGEHLEKMLILQLDLVDANLVVEAQQMEIFKSETKAKYSDEAIVDEETGEKYHPEIIRMYQLLKNGVKGEKDQTKTTFAIRNAIIHSAVQPRTSKTCIHCKKSVKRVKISYNKLVMYLSKAEKEFLCEQLGIEAEAKDSLGSNKIILADECRKFVREIYKNHSALLDRLFPIIKSINKDQQEFPTDTFFLNVLPVIPSKARPTNKIRDRITEHPRTVVYKTIIEANTVLKLILQNMKTNNIDKLDEEAKSVYLHAKGNTPHEKMYHAWQYLQSCVDQLLDSNLGADGRTAQGIKQILEKKEGLIRKHMMGKRVNFAARTVITPDPNINVDDIGVPDIFAKRLSYPVPVTSWNVSELRKMVMNGPAVHPGANYIEDEKKQKIIIPADSASKREVLAKLLLTKPGNGVKIVHRHLLNGDVLLLNRQPTLHKPSIMAHKARILHGEKTFRLHYSNCKAYNADFDGDEMNAHFPQSEVARSEAYNIVNVSNQYLVPKDGTPLGGLIQDHIISGVKLSLRGRFFNKEDYQQLVFQALSSVGGHIKLLPPAIIKPFRLWSGKQILSTIIINLIPEGFPGINLKSTAKINSKYWERHTKYVTTYGGTPLKGEEMSESEIIIRDGELLSGVLDKQQYGATPYGLVHCMYELYGGQCSTQLLSSFTRVFTYFLQTEGFTLGVKDILVTSNADKERRKIIKECRYIGNVLTSRVLNADDVLPLNELSEKLEEAYSNNPKFRILLDREYKAALDSYTNEINNVCLPKGLISQFPENNLQLMVLSGAKGSLVNTMQISCLLGQIELEGKRPPLMISGKSLPSFATFETSPKSGGFIDGRFMTGIQPQDFFFHCMAGREGLIDTAVKTSRSGYLQRCLIKHLEGLTVRYDLTVRDSDNSVVQFLYGEDGMDILKSRFFNPKCLSFLDDNAKAVLRPKYIEELKDEEILRKIKKQMKKIAAWKNKNKEIVGKCRLSPFQKFSSELHKDIVIKNPDMINSGTGRQNKSEEIIKVWLEADDELRKRYKKKFSNCPDPVPSVFKPDNTYGSINEYLENLMNTYISKNPSRKEEMQDIIYLKSMMSLVHPGEAVGLLAAQSIGEPSTQMTLNTFHFAGRGEMNVTLGIPRLREILMMASTNIKTPSMDIPFKTCQINQVEKLRVQLNKATVADVLEYINVRTKIVYTPTRDYSYILYFKFLPKEAYKEDFCVKPKNIIKYMSQKFFTLLLRAIKRSSHTKTTIVDIGEKTKERANNKNHDDEDKIESSNNEKAEIVINSDDDDDDDGDDDATGIKLKARKNDENEYDDPENEEVLLQDEESENELESDKEETTHELDNSQKDGEIFDAIKKNEMIKDFLYDTENFLWCQVEFNVPVSNRRVDMTSILKELSKKAVLHEVNNIKRAIIYKNNDDVILKTDGINIVEMFKYYKLLDLNRLYSNDIHAVAETYGIEAATRAIVREIQNVFKVYGITVDSRHLSLIADYMTFDGTFKPMSRKGMESSASPLQQMSFESSLKFLKEAAINGKLDELHSPSSRLMVGLPGQFGTGSFSLLPVLPTS